MPKPKKPSNGSPVAAPAAGIAFRPIDSLIPYARNARTHSPEQVAQIAASLVEFGFTNPVLADATGIVAGHGRVLAARQVYEAGRTLALPGGAQVPAGHVPVIDVTGWTDAQRRAYIIADNNLALNAGWDFDVLAVEIDELRDVGYDLELLGFDQQALNDMIGTPNDAPGLTDEDDAPELPAEPVSRLGDVWLLGPHRLVCGDATDAATVEVCLGGHKPHLMVTDPPYGVDYDAGWRNDAMPPKRWKDGAGRAIGAVLNDGNADWREAWALFHGDVAYVWHAGNMAHVAAESLLASAMEIRAQIIWAKSQFVIGRGHYHGHHEPCWYAVRKGATGHWGGDRTQSTLWQIDKPRKSETGHSTQKPVECMRRPIENNSARGDAVYEPFSGSGTTIIAAQMTGRVCLAIELSPAYVDVAVKRWQAFTGQRAILERTGESFADRQPERAPAPDESTIST
jgi:DNA modification methylase